MLKNVIVHIMIRWDGLRFAYICCRSVSTGIILVLEIIQIFSLKNHKFGFFPIFLGLQLYWILALGACEWPRVRMAGKGRGRWWAEPDWYRDVDRAAGKCSLHLQMQTAYKAAKYSCDMRADSVTCIDPTRMYLASNSIDGSFLRSGKLNVFPVRVSSADRHTCTL